MEQAAPPQLSRSSTIKEARKKQLEIVLQAIRRVDVGDAGVISRTLVFHALVRGGFSSKDVELALSSSGCGSSNGDVRYEGVIQCLREQVCDAGSGKDSALLFSDHSENELSSHGARACGGKSWLDFTELLKEADTEMPDPVPVPFRSAKAKTDTTLGSLFAKAQGSCAPAVATCGDLPECFSFSESLEALEANRKQFRGWGKLSRTRVMRARVVDRLREGNGKADEGCHLPATPALTQLKASFLRDARRFKGAVSRGVGPSSTPSFASSNTCGDLPALDGSMSIDGRPPDGKRKCCPASRRKFSVDPINENFEPATVFEGLFADASDKEDTSDEEESSESSSESDSPKDAWKCHGEVKAIDAEAIF